MADSNIQLNADGTGKKLDTRTESTNSEHRQVFVVGDPATNAGVAPVDATKGLAVDLSATGANATALKVDGSAVTQPVSAASLPLPSGASTAAKQPALGTAGTASSDVVTVQGVASMTKLLVTPDLPSGASTAAKQPALGTAGSASADVLSVQGVASMTALKVDGSGVTQPVSGTVTTTPPSNASTNVAQVGGAGVLAYAPSDTDNNDVGIVAQSEGKLWNSSTSHWVRQPGDVTNGAFVQIKGTSGINVAQVAGTTTDTNSGNKSAGTQRVVLATDQPALTNALKVDGSGVTQPVSLTSTTITGAVAVTESGTWTVGSSTATGSAVPANAFYNGAIAKTSLPTAATDGNLTGLMTDKFGRLVVLPGAMRDITKPITQLTLTASTTETTLITGVASTFNDLSALVVINTSATGTQVDFRDSTAGTIRVSLFVPAGDTRGVTFPVPMPQNAVNTNWTAKCSNSVSSVIITGAYIANQ